MAVIVWAVGIFRSAARLSNPDKHQVNVDGSFAMNASHRSKVRTVFGAMLTKLLVFTIQNFNGIPGRNKIVVLLPRRREMLRMNCCRVTMQR